MGRKHYTHEELAEHYDGHFLQSVTDQSDLACVLIAVSFVESALKDLVRNSLIESEIKDKPSTFLFDGNRSLSSYSQCYDMAYFLGLISAGMLSNLEILGKIRNLFAHSPIRLTFEDNQVVQLCNNLKFKKKEDLNRNLGDDLAHLLGEANNAPKETLAEATAKPRMKFLWICSHLLGCIMGFSRRLPKRKPLEDGW